MRIIKYAKLFLLPTLVAAIIIGCSSTKELELLPKSDELVAMEQYYQKISKDPKVRQYAEAEINKAGTTLDSATKAATVKQMASLVYVSNNQINIAIKAAETKAFKSRILEIKALYSK